MIGFSIFAFVLILLLSSRAGKAAEQTPPIPIPKNPFEEILEQWEESQQSGMSQEEEYVSEDRTFETAESLETSAAESLETSTAESIKAFAAEPLESSLARFSVADSPVSESTLLEDDSPDDRPSEEPFDLRQAVIHAEILNRKY